MLVSMMAVAALMLPQDAPVVTAPPVADASVAVPADIPVFEPAVLAPGCGGLLRAEAFCVSARMDQIGGLGERYLQELASKGWIAADGDDNRVVLIRRREGGGCDGMQMLAFFDTNKPQAADAEAFLGFANIPGDICAAPQENVS